MHKRRDLFRFGFWIGTGFMSAAYITMFFFNTVGDLVDILLSIMGGA